MRFCARCNLTWGSVTCLSHKSALPRATRHKGSSFLKFLFIDPGGGAGADTLLGAAAAAGEPGSVWVWGDRLVAAPFSSLPALCGEGGGGGGGCSVASAQLEIWGDDFANPYESSLSNLSREPGPEALI